MASPSSLRRVTLSPEALAQEASEEPSNPNSMQRSASVFMTASMGGGTSLSRTGILPDFRSMSLSGGRHNVPLSSTPHWDEQKDRHSTKRPSEIAPAKLRDVCLKMLSQRIEAMENRESVSTRRTNRSATIKFRASATAVSFTAILIRQKLERLAKKLASYTCDPYVVIPGLFDIESTCKRELCIFKAELHQPYCSPFDLYFALDRAPINDGYDLQWQIHVLLEPGMEDVFPMFEHAADSVVVFAAFHEGARQLLPIAQRSLSPQLGPIYHVIRDFSKQIREVTHETETEHQDELQRLLAIFSVPLPPYEQLCILPEEVQEAIRKLAFEVLKRYCYPRLLLKRRLIWRRKLIASSFIPRLAVEVLGKQSIFAKWPTSLLTEMIGCLLPLAVEKGELVIHEDENAGSGIFFLVTGQIEILKKLPKKGSGPRSKSLGPENTKTLVALNPVVCVGEFAFLTEDPRMASVRATSPSTFWYMTKNDFHRLYERLPQSIVRDINQVAFKKRTDNMLNTYPLNVPCLREYPLFEPCSDATLLKIIPHIKPYAVPRGTLVTKSGEEARLIYFLRRGSCGIFRTLRETKEELHVVTLFAPVVIGDDSVVFGSSYTSTIKAIANCDFYTLSRDDFEQAMMTVPKELDAIRKIAEMRHQSIIQKGQYRFREMVVNIPMLRDMLSFTHRVELLKLFTPVVYHPRQAICSVSEFASHVMILVEGQVRIGGRHPWMIGEAIGFTCVIPHRWATSAVALTASKVIEVERELYVNFLKKKKVYTRVVELSKALMFPKAANPQDLFDALQATEDLQTPAMYPTSQSEVVSLYEPQFGTEVIQYGSSSGPVNQRAMGGGIGKRPGTALLPAPQPASSPSAKYVKALGDRMFQKVMERFEERRTLAHRSLEDTESSQGVGGRKWTKGRILLAHRKKDSNEKVRAEDLFAVSAPSPIVRRKNA